MTNFPDKLQPFIIPEALTQEGCIELLTLSASALRYSYLRGCPVVIVQQAMQASESLSTQDKFTGVDSDTFLYDSFLATELNPTEWAQLAQFASEVYPNAPTKQEDVKYMKLSKFIGLILRDELEANQPDDGEWFPDDDLIDLSIIATTAIKQCKVEGLTSLDLKTACGLADRLQKSFLRIEEEQDPENPSLSLQTWGRILAKVSEYLSETWTNELMFENHSKIPERIKFWEGELAQTDYPQNKAAEISRVLSVLELTPWELSKTKTLEKQLSQVAKFCPAINPEELLAGTR